MAAVVRHYIWQNAIIGNTYEVEFEASGGFPPYTWILNDGQTDTYPAWLTLTPEGGDNVKAKLQNKSGQLPLLGDINSSGIPIKITVLDYTKRGDADRPDNKGVSTNETLKINGCPDNKCAVCSSKQQQFCDIKDFGTANCNLGTKKIKKCWADSEGCFVWQDQNKDCTGNETCTVARSDASVTCACNTGFEGDTCNVCAWGYFEYPTCRLPKVGDAQAISIAGVGFNMRYVPGGTFPTGMDDSGIATVDGFWMGETEVTYELWNAVYSKASEKGYTFANPGRQGGDSNTGPVGNNQHPVTTINWRDAMVWCNLASELAGLTPVYCTADQTTPIRSVDDSDIVTNALGCEDNPYVDKDANGFRLPVSMEWECAARYRVTDTTNTVQKTINGVNFASPADGVYWTKGDSASGATSNYNDKAATDKVAVYRFYMDGSQSGVTSTAIVKSELGNALSIYDMSGNVWEWCYYYSDFGNVTRGGSWYQIAAVLQVGSTSNYYPHTESHDIGFRLARNK